MNQLAFAVLDAAPKKYAATPTIAFRLRIACAQAIEALVLRVQLRIEPQWREYAAEEKPLLNDLFGTPEGWGTTLRALSWTDLPLTVTGFEGETTVELPVPLTYDLDIAATKYFHGLAGGEVPLLLLFSGTVYVAGPTGVQLGLLSWSEEASFRLPVATWRAAMDEHHPASGWIRVSTRTLDALSAYRSEHVIPTWDDTLERLLKEAR